MKKFIFKAVFFVGSLYILFAVYILLFPMNYFSTDYAGWKYKIDVSRGRTSPGFVPDVLIFGDSRAFTSIRPEHLGSKTVNLALDGTSVIEGYYLLKNYLRHNEAPNALIVSYAPFHFMSHAGYIKRTLPFRFLAVEELGEVIDIMANEKSYLYKPPLHFVDRNEWFLISPVMDGFKRKVSKRTLFWVDAALYYVGYPFKFQAELFNSGLFFRKKENLDYYGMIAENLGHYTYPIKDNTPVNQEADIGFFQANRIYTYYFVEMIKLCRDEGIRMIYVTSPMNVVSYNKLKKGFLENYMRYLIDLQKKYPDLEISRNVLFYNRDKFTDKEHLTKLGAQEFTESIKKEFF